MPSRKTCPRADPGLLGKVSYMGPFPKMGAQLREFKGHIGKFSAQIVIRSFFGHNQICSGLTSIFVPHVGLRR